MKAHFFAVIMAGGGGTRLWPISRSGQPKQLLKLVSGKSLFQISINRIEDLFPLQNTKIVTIREQMGDLFKEVPKLSADNFLIEPFPKGTAAVVGLAAVILKKIDAQAVMAVLTADHVIGNEDLFIRLLEQAYDLAQAGHLVTLGITPEYAATGYGYIKTGKKIKGSAARRVTKFVEKPNQETAETYLKMGEYFWNSGMFVWRSDRILQEFERQMPELFRLLLEIGDHYEKDDFQQVLKRKWKEIEPQTIDYGIMEKANDVVVLPAENLGWSDVGSWDSLYRLLEGDENGNVANFESVVDLDAKNNLVFSENADKIIALIGLDDVVIVHAKNALLVCRRGETQKVKQIIEEIKQRGLTEYL